MARGDNTSRSAGKANGEGDDLVFLGGTARPRGHAEKMRQSGTDDEYLAIKMVRDTFCHQRESAAEVNKTLPENAKLPEGSLVIGDHCRPSDQVSIASFDQIPTS